MGNSAVHSTCVEKLQFGNSLSEDISTEDSGPDDISNADSCPDGEYSLRNFEPADRDQLDPFYTGERQRMVRELLGLNSPGVASFLNEVECLSIGTFCGAPFALECLGLRKCAYPFDWLRSPIDGVMHCLETGFEDFLEYDNVKYEGDYKVFETSWGGSFWHHDIDTAHVREQFERRCNRFLDDGCIAPRLFVRIANSSEEVSMATKLFAKLQACFPQCQIYLLMILDMQEEARFVRVGSMWENILFCFVNEELWLRAGVDNTQHLHNCGDSYASCVAAAIGYWAAPETAPVKAEVLRNMYALESIVQDYHGGNCLDASYNPWWGSMPDSKFALDVVPGQIKGGEVVTMAIFGENRDVRIPDGVRAGQTLEFQLDGDGQIDTRLVPDDPVDSSAKSPYFQHFPRLE